MLKTIREQLLQKCIHFTGVMDKTCKVGVVYQDVKDPDARPFKFPCLQQGGHCDRRQFLTADEVEAKVLEIQSWGKKTLVAYMHIKDHHNITKEDVGTLKCECGGELKYSVTDNGHVRAHCKSCDLGFME